MTFKNKMLSPASIFYVAPKFSNFSFFTLEFKNRPLATIFFWLESEDQEIKLVWPYNASKKKCLAYTDYCQILRYNIGSEEIWKFLYVYKYQFDHGKSASSYWCMWHLLKKIMACVTSHRYIETKQHNIKVSDV